MGLRGSKKNTMGSEKCVAETCFFEICGSEIGSGKRDTFTVHHIEASPELVPECGTDFVPEF